MCSTVQKALAKMRCQESLTHFSIVYSLKILQSDCLTVPQKFCSHLKTVSQKFCDHQQQVPQKSCGHDESRYVILNHRETVTEIQCVNL